MLASAAAKELRDHDHDDSMIRVSAMPDGVTRSDSMGFGKAAFFSG
jgi:hypothetical protein